MRDYIETSTTVLGLPHHMITEALYSHITEAIKPSLTGTSYDSTTGHYLHICDGRGHTPTFIVDQASIMQEWQEALLKRSMQDYCVPRVNVLVRGDSVIYNTHTSSKQLNRKTIPLADPLLLDKLNAVINIAFKTVVKL